MKRIIYALMAVMFMVTVSWAGTSNIDSHLVPLTDDLNNLGSSSKGFNTIYTNDLTVDEIFLQSVTTKIQAQFDVGSGTITLTAAEAGFVIVTATDTATIIIPSTSSVTSGTRYILTDIGSGTDVITVDVYPLSDSTESIGGSETNTDMNAQYDILDIISVDGVGWLILNQIKN